MFQNSQIRSKILAILLLPVACLGLLAAIQIGSSLAASTQAGLVNRAAAYTSELSSLIHELQRERALAVGAAAGGEGSAFGDMITQRVRVNDALAAVRAERDRLPLDDYGRRFQDRVAAAEQALDGLDATRQELDSAPRDATAAQAALESYGTVIGALVDTMAAVPGQVDDRELARRLSAVEVLARVKEATAEETALLYGALTVGKLQPAQAQQVAGLAGAQDALTAQFTATATAGQRELFTRTVAGPANDQVAQLRAQALASPGNLAPIDPGVWLSASEAKVDALRAVEREVASGALDATAAARSSARRRALLGSVLIALVGALSVGLALVWARSMGRSLRMLRTAAHEVAERRLPAVMERLHRAELVERVDPGRTAGGLVPVGSRDEIGQVAEAFNAIHQVAMESAADQAALRRTMGEMFLNLARRNQALIDRQLDLIDDLERGEADPGRLEDLFRLDHLATRMRRTAEDLVVLSGAKPARRWTEPVGLADVARTALAEVEQYTRIDLLPISDLALAGQAVEDVVHLLAELLENATTFSPPGSKVRVAGQAVSNGYVIEIEDRGIGMPDAALVELNRRLDQPPNVELADLQKLGLHVVGRLAARYGIKVQLRHSWYGGITALVLLPEAILVRPARETAEAASLGHTELALPPPAGSENGQAGRMGGLPAPGHQTDDGDWFDRSPPRTPTRRPLVAPADAGPPAVSGQSGGPSFGQGFGQDGGQDLGGSATGTPASPWVPAGTSGPVGAVRPRLPGTPAGPPQQWPPSSPEGLSQGLPPGSSQGRPQDGQPVFSARVATDADTSGHEGDMSMRTESARRGTLPRRIPGAGARRRGAPPISQPAKPATTASGLPRRVPRASLASGIPNTPAGRPEPVAALHRTPDDIRSLLSRYRTGFERGRHDADQRPAGPAPSPYARSDDDAVE